MRLITAATLRAAAPLICDTLKREPQVAVLIEPAGPGYWAALKTPVNPPAAWAPAEIARYLRMRRDPQPYHVRLTPWRAYVYRDLHRGAPSSAI
jgi:hypothetical protein